jgi:hypothetical protein
LVAATDDSDAEGIAVSEPVTGVETGNGNGGYSGSEETAF